MQKLWFKFKRNILFHLWSKVISKRFTLKKSVGWLFANIFNLDKGFLSTTWDLIKKPGKVVSNFLNGITVPYAHPFRFIFVWATVSTLIALYTGAYDKMGKIGLDMCADVNEQGGVRGAFVDAYMELLKQYMSVVYMMLVPFFSICTSLFYRKHKLYFPEHLILHSYSQGVSIALGLQITLLYLIVPPEGVKILSGTSMIIGLSVVSYVNSRFFGENIFL